MDKIKGILIMAGKALVIIVVMWFLTRFLVAFAIQSCYEFVDGELFGGVKLIFLLITLGALLYITCKSLTNYYSFN